ncbi:MAG: phosphoribosylformimino-5-aminoimidazole carboxamide ribotide isomerase [Ilumatobacteraceae bacterium]
MFRPCIDLRNGSVVQIVGGTFSDDPTRGEAEKVNFVSTRLSASYAMQYRDDRLEGGHVIMLGPGNDQAALQALSAWPGGMQIGGGIDGTNARQWLDAGASHVIVTSWLFVDGSLSASRLGALVDAAGRDRLVIDLSCRWRDGAYWVVTDRWQRFTDVRVDREILSQLADSCAEFLVHGVDVEGLSQGIDLELVSLLAEHSPIRSTYAGGARSLADLQTVHDASNGQVDLTIGSALDIFGGTGVTYAECVEFNRTHSTA